MRRLAIFLASALAIAAVLPASAQQVTGTATYRERIAMPPGAVFEAVIEDISRADAPAEVIGRTVIEDAPNPPIPFAIDYDPAGIDAAHSYSVRATIRVDDRLLFTTDTVAPVITRGAPTEVELLMVMVSDPPPPPGAAEARIGAHGLRLPATFEGVLPCADCEGIAHHLDLWPDQSYAMRRVWLRGDAPLVRDEVGRWYVDPVRDALILYGASEMPLQWRIAGIDRLRLLDMAGNPIQSELNYDLTAGPLAPTDLDTFLVGRFAYNDTEAGFEECLTRQRFPVLRDQAAWDDLVAAHDATGTASRAPVLANVEGRVFVPAPGAPRSLAVDRVGGVQAGVACPPDDPQIALTDTYWVIESLGGAPLASLPDRREPYIVLFEDESGLRYAATVGCNMKLGGAEADGDALSFAMGASTLMACPPPLDTDERALTEVLAATASIRSDGTRAELLDAGGAVIAELRADYFRF